MTTKVNVMVSLGATGGVRGVKGVEDDYQSECDGEFGRNRRV